MRKTAAGWWSLVCLTVIVVANLWLPERTGSWPDAGLWIGSTAANHAPPPAFSAGTLAAWIVTMAGMVVLLVLIGIALRQRPAGVLIDNRNRISLSKLQMIGWTVMILSGIVTIAATMLAGLASAPPAIEVPDTLLTLMGISLASATATPALLSLKPGAVDTNAVPGDASWTDLVQGDDVSNADAPDITKIQQLVITLIVMGVFLFQLGDILHYGGAFRDAAGHLLPYRVALPDLGPDLAWLVGISHVGYLTYKAVPHTDKERGAATPAAAVPAGDGAVG